MQTLLEGYINSKSLHQQTFSLDPLSCPRSLFLYLKALYDALELLISRGVAISWSSTVASFMDLFVRAIISEEISIEKLEVKKMYMYVDDSFSEIRKPHRAGLSEDPPNHVTAVDFGCRIILYCLRLVQTDSRAMATLDDCCRDSLIRHWLPLPTKLVRNTITEAITMLVSHDMPHMEELIGTCFSRLRDLKLSADATTVLLPLDQKAHVECAAWVKLTSRLILSNQMHLLLSGPSISLLEHCGGVLASVIDWKAIRTVSQGILCCELIEFSGRFSSHLLLHDPAHASAMMLLTTLHRLMMAFRDAHIVQIASQAMVRIALVSPAARGKPTHISYSSLASLLDPR